MFFPSTVDIVGGANEFISVFSKISTFPHISTFFDVFVEIFCRRLISFLSSHRTFFLGMSVSSGPSNELFLFDTWLEVW